MFLKNDQNRSLERTLETIDIGNFENIGKRSNFFKIIVFACETHNALQLPVFYFFSFFLWLCQCYRNIDKFGAKNYFTDHRTANTMYPFRDSFPILKIHDCYWDTQKFEQPSIPGLHSFPFQITPHQKMTDVTSHDHEASLISPITEAEGAWKLVKKL